MHTLKSAIFALGVIGVLAVASGASAETIIITKERAPVNFRPGPLHVTPYPVYFDPRHDESKYDYWQRERYERLSERAKHDRQTFVARHGYEPPAGVIYYPEPVRPQFTRR